MDPIEDGVTMASEKGLGRTRGRSDWSTFWPSLWVSLIGSVLVGGIVAVGVAWVSAQIQRGIDEQAASVATCDNPQQLRLVDGIDAVATEQLEYVDGSGESHVYPASNLVDRSQQTPWIGQPASGGVGARIELRLPYEGDVRLICVLNGYASTGELFGANGSVRVLTVETAAGTRDAVLPRLSEANFLAYQPLVIAPGRTQHVTLTVQTSDVPKESAAFGPASASLSEIEVWVKQ